MQDLSTITSALLQDYAHGRPIDNMFCAELPTAAACGQLLETLRMLFFPGFCRLKNAVHFESHVALLVADVYCRLDGMLLPLLGNEQAHCQRICTDFLLNIPRLRSVMQQDLQAFLSCDPAATDEAEVITAYPGFQAIAVHRIANCLLRLGVPLLPRLLAEIAHSRTGIDIHPGASIGPAFFIDHGTGVVIGESAVIGTDVKIYQGVTLGALSTRDAPSLRGKKRHPTIDDGVSVYANASILGGATHIGAGAIIGANAFVTASVPAGKTVIGHWPDL